jgi:hypothetical protein
MFRLLDPPAVAVLVLAATTGDGGVPRFNVEPHCRAVAAMAAPVGDARVCLRHESGHARSSRGNGVNSMPRTRPTACNWRRWRTSRPTPRC